MELTAPPDPVAGLQKGKGRKGKEEKGKERRK